MGKNNRSAGNITSISGSLSDWLYHFLPDLPPHAIRPTIISKKNVFRPGKEEIWQVFVKLLSIIVKEKSQLLHFENLSELYQHAEKGHSCLLMLEHYSNFDFPGLIYLLENHNHVSRTIRKHIIPMATMKLNEDNPYVSIFTDAFDHISIFPARRLDELKVATHDHEELKRAREINMAALKTMRSRAQEGDMILMFPSGTRYKPNNPQTKQVIRSADSFMKRFEYVVFGGIAGNTLLVNNPKDTLSDIINEDVLVYSFSKVYKCKEFRKAIKKQMSDDYDRPYELINERIQEELEREHEIAKRQYDRLKKGEDDTYE